MSKKTIQERLIVALTALGMKEVGSKSRKYRVMMKDMDNFYLCGKSGALRKNNRPVIQGSISLTANVQSWLEERGF